MPEASFAAGIRIARGFLAPGTTLPQDALLPSHVVEFVLWFSELASAMGPSCVLVWSLLSSFSMPAACGLLEPNTGSVRSSTYDRA